MRSLSHFYRTALDWILDNNLFAIKELIWIFVGLSKGNKTLFQQKTLIDCDEGFQRRRRPTLPRL